MNTIKKTAVLGGVLAFVFFFCLCKPENVYKEKNGKEMLDSLVTQCKHLNRSPELLTTAVLLKEEAKKQKDDLYIGYGYNYILNYYLNNLSSDQENTIDTIRLYGQKAKEYFKKAGEQVRPLRVEANILRWEIHFTNPENIFYRVFELLEDAEIVGNEEAKVDAYSILGAAYLLSSSPQEAFNAFQKELQSLRNVNTNDSLYILGNYLYTFSELGDAALQMRDYDEVIANSDSIRKYIKLYKDVPLNTKSWEINADNMTVKALSVKNKLIEAHPYVENLLSYLDDSQIRQTHLYRSVQYALTTYYLNNKEYNKTLEIINNIIEQEEASHNSFGLNKAQEVKSSTLYFLGRFEEAYLLKQEIVAYNDSVFKKNAARQISEMYTLYNVDILERRAIENEAKANNSQTIAISMIIISVLFLLIIISLKQNYNKLKKKNEKLFEQYRNIDKYRREISNLNLSVQEEANGATKELSLFEKIENCMHENQLYRESDITRESLALHVGTNRQYLTQAIHENMDMTFNEYINHYRLEYTRQMLIENTNLTIENIYTSAGFNNKSTFYRLFKQKYDLTPKEIKDIALEHTTDKSSTSEN